MYLRMSEQVLYRKHRPRDFSEVVGQDHVTGAVANAFKMGRVAHAYLFSGPRGVGKTSMARLIAKSLNCEKKGKRDVPCNECAMCADFNEGRALDVIEIDAASNGLVDDVRILREGVRMIPVQGKYKTYIIDEVQRMSKSAFDALLKTLEEPPSHVVFILATTELEKVPATIISRTQHYTFRRPQTGEMAGRLRAIAKKEGVDITEDAARLIALAAEGSFRDAESILGQIMAVEDKKITRREAEETLGLPPREAAKQMFALIAQKKAPEALALIQELSSGGYDLAYFTKLLMQYFRAGFLLKTDPALKPFVASEMLDDEYETIMAHLPSFTTADLAGGAEIILGNLQRFKKTPIPQLPLELTVIALIDGNPAKRGEEV